MREYSIERNPTMSSFAIVMYLMIIGPKFGINIPWHKLVEYQKNKQR